MDSRKSEKNHTNSPGRNSKWNKAKKKVGRSFLGAYKYNDAEDKIEKRDEDI